MEKKEYLNEEVFQKTKKKIISIAVAVLMCGILLGGGLITLGIIKANTVDSKSNKRSEEVIQTEIDTLNNELSLLRSKLIKEFESNSFSEEYYKLQNEVSQKQRKIENLEDELWKASSGYNSTISSMSKSKSIPFYMFGVFIIIVSGMISLSIYLFAKSREITAFTTQQVMPIAKEGLDKIAPTVGNAAKEIAKGITAGIEEGKNKNTK